MRETETERRGAEWSSAGTRTLSRLAGEEAGTLQSPLK